MLIVDIALGVAGGLLLVKAGEDLLNLPNQIANRRQRERHHEEFIGSLVEVAQRAEAAAREAMAPQPKRRKPTTKKAPVKKPAPTTKKPVTTKKGK
jgi:hypothetical protein